VFDVCIVGAGPAGSTLARLLGSSHRVLLVDRRPLERSFALGDVAKSCGGLLSPAAQRVLAHQGLGVPRSVLSGPQLFAVRTVDRDSGLERLYQRHYVNVDREAFDRWLVSLVPGGVTTAFGWRLRALTREDGGTMLQFDTPGEGRASVRAALVVGADGAASVVRNHAFDSAKQAARYVAVQGEFLATGYESSYGAYFDRELTDHYAWTVPKGDTVLAGIAFPDGRDTAAKFSTLLARLREAGFPLGAELSRSSTPVLRPTGARDIVLGDDAVVLLGEAASLISPSSAEGISYALRSAEALAAACEPGLSRVRARYARAVAPLVGEVVAKTIKAALISGPTARRAVLASGIGAIGTESGDWYGATLGELLAP
jgi:flavin-dependent dehydrogenase